MVRWDRSLPPTLASGASHTLGQLFLGLIAMNHRLFAALAVVASNVACADRSTSTKTTMDATLSKSMQDFKERVRYRVLDVPTLMSIPNEKLVQAVMDYIDYKIEGVYSHEPEIVNALSPGVRALYITWWLEGEVNNGGFNQYFWNAAGQFASLAPESFDFFGASQHAALMREAIAVRAAEAQTISEFKRQGTLKAFSASYEHTQLNALDDKFYELKETMTSLRVAKIRSHPELFVGS